MTEIESLRRSVALNYCSAIAVIDDDAYINYDEGHVGKDFKALVKNCNQAAILCHLHQYPKVTKKNSINDFGDLSRAIQIAEKADLVILDWFLGLSNDCDRSLKIIKKLMVSDSFHVIIVYTQQPVDKVIQKFMELKFELKSAPQVVSRGEESEPVLDGDTSLDNPQPHVYAYNDRVFVSIVNKSDLSGEALVQFVHRTLLFSFADLLHLSVMELFYRIKTFIPTLLPIIPKGLDVDLAIQTTFKSFPNELSIQMGKIILEEIEKNLQAKSLHALSDQVLDEIKYKNIKNEGSSSQSPDETIKDKFKKKITNEKLLSLGTSLENQHKLNSILESYLSRDNGQFLNQGVVIRDKKKYCYLLCITPLCDLYDIAKDSQVTFIKGEEFTAEEYIHRDKTYHVNIYSDGIVKVIKWDLSDFYQIKISEQNICGYPSISNKDFKKYEVVGRLRNDITSRIIQRTWSYRTRVGVDIVEGIRKLRGDK